MIAQLKGQIVASDLTYLVLDVMGVGYQVLPVGAAYPSLAALAQKSPC